MTSFLRLGKQPAQRLGLAARNLARRAVDCACFKSDIKINDDVNCCQAETHHTVARYDDHKSQGKKRTCSKSFYISFAVFDPCAEPKRYVAVILLQSPRRAADKSDASKSEKVLLGMDWHS